MKKVLFVFCLFTVHLSLAQTDDFQEKWEAIDSLELQGQINQALELTKKLTVQAEREKDYPSLIRSKVFFYKFHQINQEDSNRSILKDINQTLANLPVPYWNLFQSYKARILQQYYMEHRWQIDDRKDIDNPDPQDLDTWAGGALKDTITKAFNLSLRNKKEISRTPVDEISELLLPNSLSRKYRPNLFDLLAYEALTYFSNPSNFSSPSPEKDYPFQTPALFGDQKEFGKLEFDASASREEQILSIYQDLEKLHKNRKEKAASLYAELARLEYVSENYVGQNPWELYQNSLEALLKRYRKDPLAALIMFVQAREMEARAENKDDNDNLLYPDYRKKALALSEKIISEYPNTYTAQNAYRLQSAITNVEIQAKHQDYLPSETPGLLHVSYKSLDSLRLRVWKVTGDFLQDIHYNQRDSIIAQMVQKQALVDKSYDLPLSGDYNSHSTELAIPGLNHGRYLVHLTGPTSSEKEGYTYSFLQVTDLVLKSTNLDQNYFQLLHRDTGLPIEGARVSLKNSDKEPIKELTTPKDGRFTLDIPGSRYVQLEISKADDTLTTSTYSYNRSSSDAEEPVAKTIIYLDRAIYRPGQTVYFKGVLLKKENGNTTTVPREPVEVFVENVNRQEIHNVRQETNDYGSFSGEFKLPETGIPGQFRIGTNEDPEANTPFWNLILMEGEYQGGVTSFSVEEYKRPSFEVDFDTISQAFRLNDNVSISGNATSFMGAALGGARVHYEITRQKQVFSWWRPNLEQPVVVKTDSLLTDEDGNFEIQFPATPASQNMEEEDLVYHYTISAAVTDLSGETREGSTTVKIGKKNLLLNLEASEKVNTTDSLSLYLTTTNLNDKQVPTKGTLKIYKLQGPDRILKERPWEAPEVHILGKEEFIQLFPELSFEKLGDPREWPKGQLVFESEFKNDGQFEKQIPVEGWIPGKYIIEVKARNKQSTSQAKSSFDVLDASAAYLADHQRLKASLQNDNILQEGEIRLLLQTAYKDLNLQVSVYDQQEVLYEKFININGRKELDIPVKETSAGELQVQIIGVKNNASLTETIHVPLKRFTNSLNIVTETFRNKIKPGLEETWSFSIRDANDEIPEAEILASMYDASLDQFKISDWNTSGFSNRRSNYPWTRLQTISSVNYMTNRFPRIPPFREFRVTFDQLQLFGLYFSEPNSYSYRRYLAMRKSQEKPLSLQGNTRGRVTNLQGQPLPGVNVIIQDTKKGSVTNMQGEFALDTQKGDILSFSYLGFDTVEFPVGSQKEIFVVLEGNRQALDEMVVVGYGVQEEAMAVGAVPMEVLSGKVQGLALKQADGAQSITIQGVATGAGNNRPLYIVDGEIVLQGEIPVDEIISTEVLEGATATAIYGTRAANGAVVITTKKSLEALQQVETRTDLDETAFFLPHLQLGEDGNVSFTFTSPEGLTHWKLRLLAHTRDWTTGTFTGTVRTQKELSVMPNPPRFLRTGDRIVFQAKLVNLSDQSMTGTAVLQLFDALTMEPIDSLLLNADNLRNFQLKSSGSEALSWKFQIPEGIEAVTYRILARAGDFSDGEENLLPVLSNKMLVHESLPIFVRAGETETYEFTNLKENDSETLNHQSLSLEYTTNPAWSAVLSLPYLLDYEHACSEQIFARLYANSLASHILNSQPKLKEVFQSWRKDSSLVSELQKKEGLSSLILSETPWLKDAVSETERKQYIAKLLELEKLASDQREIIARLREMQNASGAFPWFSGGRDNIFITRHVLAGFGHLQKLGVSLEDDEIIQKGLEFLDEYVLERAEEQGDSTVFRLSYLGISDLHYLYTRSFFLEQYPPEDQLQELIEKMVATLKEDWLQEYLYGKALSMLVFSRYGETETARTIMSSLKQTSVKSEDHGMYWKENTSGWFWYEAPVETQALLIEAFSEIGGEAEAVEEMKIWLLQNKRSNHWPSTKSTTVAIYALLMQGQDWLLQEDNTRIEIGGNPIPEEKLEATEKEVGSGYRRLSWNGQEVEESFGEITVENNNTTPGYGAAYWTYYEKLDKIKSHSESPLNIEKQLYLNLPSASGKTLKAITPETPLQTGDLVTVRLVVRATADMDFIHLKDMRASGFEPTNVLSSHKYQDGTSYYESTGDEATHFFFDHLRKGTYVLEYTVRANNAGSFSNGITSIESMYAPEFSGHTKGIRVKIE